MARRLPTHDGDHRSLDSVPAQRALPPQAAARRGTRTRTSEALGLRSVRSSCTVIDVSSWSAGRQASPGLCIHRVRMVGESVGPMDRRWRGYGGEGQER